MVLLEVDVIHPTTGVPYGVYAWLRCVWLLADMCVFDSRVSRAARGVLLYLAGFTIPTHPGHMGALVDNDVRIGVRMLQQSDRESVQAARIVFDQLFWTAKRVRITSVWQIGTPIIGIDSDM